MRGKNLSFFSHDQLLKAYHNLLSSGRIGPNQSLLEILKLKSTRSDSGIVVVSVLTKPFACPGKCIYCPDDKSVPKSYLPNEPAVMRALTCKFDPFLQVKTRLRALNAVGHNIDKINIRIIGGTWSYYPNNYQNWFVRRLYQGCNTIAPQSNSMFDLQKANEKSKHRIVEVSVETRQDHITLSEIKRLRSFGVTKVELGVQSLYDNVLKMNNRGNSTLSTIQATKLLKENGFKVSYQMMVNLLGADLVSDQQMFADLFSKEGYKPDHLKIYPLALIAETGLYQHYLAGRFKPYSQEELISLLSNIKESVPKYCRIERVIRDIPAQNIVEGGAKISNLRQIVNLRMEESGKKCVCIRCREIKSDFDLKDESILKRIDYKSSDGIEIFLSYESVKSAKIYSFLRLRINNDKAQIITVLKKSGLIREIHTYGPQMRIGQKSKNAAQHQGFGKALIAEAERIAKEEFGLQKMAVISGVGVHQYFEKLGYGLKQTYMVKKI